MKVVRVEVVRSGARSALAPLTPAELPALERELAADPEVEEWYVTEEMVEGEKA